MSQKVNKVKKPKIGTKGVKRSENWKEEEITTLIDEYEKSYDKLTGKFSVSLTAQGKAAIFAKITDAVNDVFPDGVKRDVASIKSKIKDLKKRSKKNAATLLISKRKTGGGSTDEDDLDPVDEKLSSLANRDKRMLKLMDDDAIVGIKGGIDTSKMSSSALEEESIPKMTLISEVPHSSTQTPTTRPTVIQKPIGDSTPKCSNKRKTMDEENSIGQKILEQEIEANGHRGRIANSLEELVMLKKLELKLNPLIPIREQFIEVTNDMNVE